MKDKNIKTAKKYAENLVIRLEAVDVSAKRLLMRAGKHPDLLKHWLEGRAARKSSLQQVEIVMRHYEAIAKKYPAKFNQPKDKENGTT